ncbi:hypothetical protein [Yersinia phage fHe-Yen9-04]|uniref:Uncharacterized protein n=2 Tax=Eneladusvirus Yen904 TaxID=2560849 RepID=A0A2C9CX80_9CAUD|nr:hypothetical protein FDJ41_gp140 [Yersinia phage fHe-Yen9-04]SOK58417.1 hypothetical protein [Yersinia phage fHe-Yen9-04]SOK58951.1 hypothetical protein [Yersinia phage fHe-Yen9-03]VUE36186.1 hypothetical protein [Yersinia phage fHe-Yen9-04]
MGYTPKSQSTKKDNENIINLATMQDIHQHLYILVLRKSAGKLIEYIMQFKNRKEATNAIISVKYELSKCRPEVLNILLAMAKDPKRFEFSTLSTNDRMFFVDNVNGTNFRIYDFSSNPKKIIPNVTINNDDFLTSNEELVMYKIAKSMIIMRNNQYKLQEELRKLEEQNNVFKIYQNEKLLP